MVSRYASRSRKHHHTCTVRAPPTDSSPAPHHTTAGLPLLLVGLGLDIGAETAEGHSVAPRTLYLGRKSDGTGALATRAIHHLPTREQERECATPRPSALGVRVTHPPPLPLCHTIMPQCLLAGGIEAERKQPRARFRLPSGDTRTPR